MEHNCAVVLAAGEGKRMKSDNPKVLSRVLFKPMLGWVLDAVEGAGITDTCVVTGHKREKVETYLSGRCESVFQEKQLGTGHAVMQAKAFLEAKAFDHVLVLCGDAPLMDKETITQALAFHKNRKNAVTVISAKVKHPYGYGRIVRSKAVLSQIIEERDATGMQKEISEVNSGTYWFKAEALLSVLDQLDNQNAQNEYYLTDAITILIGSGASADAFTAQNPDVVLGANDRIQLLELNNRARLAILKKWMLDGVELMSIDNVFVGPDVKIGQDTVLLPGTMLKGQVEIGAGCVIGPNTVIQDSKIGEAVTLNNVQCVDAVVKDAVTAGPYVNIRPGSVIASGVKIGDFVEIKNSNLGRGSKVPHLTYVGDSDIGANVNFGCGCVTVNYDGQSKNRCVVKDNAFIGCNTNLIAPVEVGEGAYTAAGSTVTESVPAGALAIARQKQVNKQGWAKKNR